MSDEIYFAEVDYGFEYGAAKVTLVCSDRKKKWVVLAVETPRAFVEIYVTKTGKMRIFHRHGATFEQIVEVANG